MCCRRHTEYPDTGTPRHGGKAEVARYLIVPLAGTFDCKVCRTWTASRSRPAHRLS